MSTSWKAAAIAATVVAMSACSTLTAYQPDTPATPMDATTNLASSRMPDISATPDKVEGSSGPAVMGPTS